MNPPATLSAKSGPGNDSPAAATDGCFPMFRARLSAHGGTGYSPAANACMVFCTKDGSSRSIENESLNACIFATGSSNCRSRVHAERACW